MKKIIVMLITIICLFSACSVTDNFKDEPELTQLTGLLTEQSSSDDMLGTHIITDEDTNKFAVRSVAINLSDNQYLDNKVQVFVVYDKDEDVYTITGISVIDVLSDKTFQKPTLIPYKNTDLGFEIKYYDDWEINENDVDVEFVSPKGDLITVTQETFLYEQSVFDSSGKDSPLAFYASQKLPELGDVNPNMLKIGIDSLNALKLDNDYYLYRNGLIYIISFSPLSQDDEVTRQFEEMLNEFRFIGFTVDGTGEDLLDSPTLDIETGESDIQKPSVEFDLDTEDYTFFDSLPYSFRAMYPDSWYYAGSSSKDPNILHHYGFSNESVTDENELFSLDVISNPLPSGTSVNINGKPAVKVISGDVVNYYVELGGHVYKVSGSSEYDDLIQKTTASISEIELEEI